MHTRLMRSAMPLVVLIAALAYVPARAQEIDHNVAIACGCKPDMVMLPHYVESGRRTVRCASSPGPGHVLPLDGVTGYVRYSHVASSDNPGDHQWHDFNFYVAFDKKFQYLNSTENYKNTNNFLDCIKADEPGCAQGYPEHSKAGERLMEMEWDMTHFPEKFWPHAGDYAWIFGRYIWDCGHPEGFHNEIHPPTAVAFTRPESDTEKLGGTTDLVQKTYVYVNGRSGLTCLFDDYLNTPVATRDYKFSIPLPSPAPAGGQPYAEVVELPYGGPKPRLEIKINDKDEPRNRVDVTYPLNLGDPRPSLKFGAVIASGWRNQSPPVTYRRLVVDVKKLKVRRRHGLLCQTDWQLWLNVNGQWVKLQDSFGMIDGSDVEINKKFRISVPDTDRGRLIIQVTGWFAMFDQFFGSRLSSAEIAGKFPSLANWIGAEHSLTTQDGKIGLFFRRYTKPLNFGVGTNFDESGLGDLSDRFHEVDGKPGLSSTSGDFSLYYSITQE